MAGSPDPIPGWSYFAHVQNIYIAVTATVPPMALGITWSLAVEEQFYLLFPPILRRLPAGSLPLVVGSLVLLAIPVRMSFETFPARHALLPCRMDSLMVGVLAAWVVRQPGLMARLRENRAAVGFLGAVLLFGSFALALRPPASWAFGVLVLDPTWVAAMYGVFLLRLRLAPEGPAAALMRWAPLRWLGLISYPVYLFHGIIHDAVIRGMVASLDWSAGRIALAGAATSFTLTLLLSWALHRLVERPLIAVGHSFRYPARPE
jgi:peptidoglycan/LPS O-acetylase OafA/YrhL